VVNLPGWYREADRTDLERLLDESWDDSFDTAEKEITATRLAVLASAKFWNGVKAWALFVAVSCEAAAVGFIAYAVWLAL
jgi:hypothetical protein